MRDAAAEEARLGLEVFYTDTRGTGGRLRADPEDFIVDEVPEIPPERGDGRHCVAWVTARNWEMNRLVRQLARSLRISRDRIGFAGTKDKRAVTRQVMSFDVDPERLLALNVKDVDIEFLHMARRRVCIGDLKGNRFTLRVSDVTLSGNELVDDFSETRARLEGLGGFPNFFGYQRFGISRPITHTVGKYIVRGDIEGAVMSYVCDLGSLETEESTEARNRLREEMDFEAALSYFPGKLTFERMVIGHLAREPGDWCGAIMALPRNLQMMFVHAYQSYLFNRMLSERMRRSLPIDAPIVGDVVLPIDGEGVPSRNGVRATSSNIDLVERQVSSGRALVSAVLYGSESELSGGEMGEIEASVIESEGLSPEDFIVPGLQNCSSTGSRREILAQISDLETSLVEGGYEVRFMLTKGNYATSLMREFMKSPIPNY